MTRSTISCASADSSVLADLLDFTLIFSNSDHLPGVGCAAIAALHGPSDKRILRRPRNSPSRVDASGIRSCHRILGWRTAAALSLTNRSEHGATSANRWR